MLFPTHLVIAALVARRRFPVVWAVVGAALPDLVDKPLAMIGVTTFYHSVAHSVLFGIPILAVWLVVRTTSRGRVMRIVQAGAVGWASHLAADAVHLSLNGRPSNTVFLLWPLVSEWDSIEAGPGPFVVQYVGTPSFYLEAGIWAVAGYLLFQWQYSRTAAAKS